MSRQEFPTVIGSEFEELVLCSKLPVALYITCKCCRTTDSARREFVSAAQYFKDSIGIFIVDADVEKALVSRLNVKATPALLAFSSGTETLALLGFYSADELQKRLQSIIPTGEDV